MIRAGALGDTLLALPALGALHAWNEGGSLELVGYPSLLRLATLAVPVNTIHSIDRALFAGLFSDAFADQLVRLLGGFDLIVAWTGGESVGLPDKLERAGVPCLQKDPSPPPGVHASLHLLQSLSPLGIRDSLSPPRLEFPGDVLQEAHRFLNETRCAKRRFLAVHPGSGSPLKTWAPERFSSLIGRSRVEGRSVLIIEGEADREAVNALREMLDCRAPIAAGLELPVLGAVLAEAAVFVGNDSGVSHLAAAAGAPTLALFGPTDPTVWAPLGESVETLPHSASDESVWQAVRRLSRPHQLP